MQLESNAGKTENRIRVIGGNRPSIIRRDLMENIGQKLMQKQPERKVMAIDQDATGDPEIQLNP